MQRRISSRQLSQVSPARLAAYQVLLRVETRDSYATELLHSELLKDLSSTDRALTTEIVLGTLRWQSKLDFGLVLLSGRPISKMDPEVRIALRIAAYQILYLERIPARAAVNESVELVKLARKRSAATLVNAVLRKLSGAPEESTRVSEQIVAADLAIQYAHPEWLVERWSRNFGEEKAENICRFDQERPITSIRVVSTEAEQQVREEGVELAPGAILNSARRVLAGDITRTAAWQQHKIFIQDEASQLIPLLIGKGKKFLDCCAAPGGKAVAIATRNPGALVVASELHPHRARKMRELLADKKIHVIAADARQVPLSIQFDRVLADLPCSGTGTLARNPEIKWKLKPEDIFDLQSRQKEILASALQHLEAGGRLLYSTCSLEPEEGEAVIGAVLHQHLGFRILPLREELARLQDIGELAWPDPDSLVSGNYLRTVPGIHPCDGFFAALLERS